MLKTSGTFVKILIERKMFKSEFEYNLSAKVLETVLNKFTIIQLISMNTLDFLP